MIFRDAHLAPPALLNNTPHSCHHKLAGRMGEWVRKRETWIAVNICLYLSFKCIFAASIHRSGTCQLQGRFKLNGIYQDGDVILGGLFEVHFFTVFPELSFRTEPEPPYCEK